MRANRFCIAACLGLALLCGATGSRSARGQEPANPLRTVNAAQPLAHSLLTAEEQIAEPPSVVPELLPAPAAAYPPENAALDYPLSHDGLLAEGLVHPWLARPWFSHSDPNDPHRHIGLGQPLVGTSWRNRPLYVGTFVGGILLGELQDNVAQNDTAFLGVRLGWDFDHYWGLEGRWAYAHPELIDGAGAPLPDPSRDYFADVSLAFYPLGDARWRPYLVAGLGFQTYRFNNDVGHRISEASFSVPLGVGIKIYTGNWCSLRFDFVDNIAFGNERLNAMNNIGLMAGFEYRFGGRRQSYFPWHNNTSYF